MNAHHFWVSLVSGDSVRITPVIFRTGLRRWRSVFLCPTTGYLTRVCKSAFCGRRKLFFVRSSPLRERALDGRVPYEKSTQLPLSAFACFRDPDRIRTCDPQLRRLLLYPAELPDQSFIFSSSDGLMSKEGAKIMLYFYFANRFLLHL